MTKTKSTFSIVKHVQKGSENKAIQALRFVCMDYKHTIYYTDF